MTPELGGDGDWYRDAVIYQTHVRAFQDSDDDGVGDFDGLRARLDYVQELGATAVWILPFYPSPLRDDGYDIADYRAVHPDYGSLPAFRRFLREAHRRDLRVITELVVNHTSDQHPWFQRARRARSGSRARDFYVWSDEPNRYLGARVIFPDFESSNWAWDPVADAYYWHRFYSHQPDLNFENPAVHDAMLDALDFWLGQGVDGLRLDAVPYLFEAEGTNCENLPETHAFLRKLRAHVDARFPQRMLLAEANQWPEDAVAYFGEGDECHMAFHFPLMPRLFMAVQMEDRFPVTEILEQTPSIPESCQWATFLRNHDELTLEMVSDEERDYMYRVYAHERQMRVNLGIRRRLAPLMQNDRRRIELMHALLFSLPGTPLVYYGDEIGMGDNVWLGDRNAVRTPMQWNTDRNAGFSRANPQSLYLPVIIDPEYHYEKVNVETQLAQSSSLLRWMRQTIALRQRSRVFGRGSIEFLAPENPKILAFVRELGDEQVLVVANLSRFGQPVELDLSRWVGLTPVELFGATPFPPIGSLPYYLTLGPYAFQWFGLEHQRTEAPVISPPREEEHPTVRVAKGERHPLQPRSRVAVARALADWLPERRWFGAKARSIQSVQIVEVIPVPGLPRSEPAWIVLAEVEFRDGNPATYVIPLNLASGERAEQLVAELAHGVVATVDWGDGSPAVLAEALWSPAVTKALLDVFRRRRAVRGERGELRLAPTGALRSLLAAVGPDAEARILRGEQSNTSVVYDDAAVLKLFRRPEAGPNPEAELGRYLQRAGFEHVPPFAGTLEYRPRRGEPSTVAVLQGYVVNEGDAWRFTLDALARFLDDVLEEPVDEAADAVVRLPMVELARTETPEVAEQAIGPYLGSAALLGRRTAELHLALARPTEDPDFAPASYSQLDRRALYQSMRNLARRNLQLLSRRVRYLPEDVQALAEEVLACEATVLARFGRLLEAPLTGTRIRTHGDFHLGQVLYTGRDFVIIDFEGEPARALGERRLKRSPLRDVAGMIRSFDYAVHTALHDALERGRVTAATEQWAALEHWGALWFTWVAATFLREYRAVTAGARFLPRTEGEESLLLEIFLLDKALYELGYELDHRPDWAGIPLLGILRHAGAPG